MRPLRFSATVAAVLTLAAGLASEPTEARIVCQGMNQVMKGGRLLPTPYCQDQLLARVARSRGFNVSADTLRHNSNRKSEICRYIGHDNRVRSACSPHMPSPGDGGATPN